MCLIMEPRHLELEHAPRSSCCMPLCLFVPESEDGTAQASMGLVREKKIGERTPSRGYEETPRLGNVRSRNCLSERSQIN